MEFTIVSVIGTLILGWFIGRKFLKVDRNTSYLISSGTAICGGSAIAAVGPVVKANDSEMSVALATIFILNALALFIFPVIGHALNMSQHEFGTWAAIAIHDTSSVVGAGAAYGEEALKVATTIKLTRALWIIPMAFATSFIFKSKGQKISIPWFIFFFVLAMIVNTYLLGSVPELVGSQNIDYHYVLYWSFSLIGCCEVRRHQTFDTRSASVGSDQFEHSGLYLLVLISG